MITEGKAAYMVNIDCPSLSFRKNYRTIENHLTISIDTDLLGGQIEVFAGIVATEDIYNYKNEKFNKIYDGIVFDISKGNYLAYAQLKTITFDRDNLGLKKLSDFILISTDKNASDTFKVEMDNDYLVVKVNSDIKNNYYVYGKDYLYNVISMIFVPAMVYVLTNLASDSDLYTHYRWYKYGVGPLLETQDINPSDLDIHSSNGKNSVLEIAQKIFKEPLLKGLKELGKERIGDAEND